MEFLKYLESIRTPFGETFFYIMTFFGEEVVLLGVMGIIYWCVNKKTAYRMTFAYLLSALFINTLKVSLKIERPWVRDPEFTAVERAKVTATGYSFPSGHTQNATSLYGTLACVAKKVWVSILFVILIGMVMLSRMYLGVHTPADVVVSFMISGIIVIITNLIADKTEFTAKKRLITACLVVAAGIAYLVFTIIVINSGYVPYDKAADGCKGVGAGIAFAICWYVESTYINFDTKCRYFWQQIIKILLGAGGVLAIRSGIKAAFGTSFAADTIRYFLMIIWAMMVMPLLIKKFFNTDKGD